MSGDSDLALAGESAGRLHLVRMAVLITAEIEVVAHSAAEATRLAESQASAAQRVMQTAPYGFRVYTRQRDPNSRDEWIWVEIA